NQPQRLAARIVLEHLPAARRAAGRRDEVDAPAVVPASFAAREAGAALVEALPEHALTVRRAGPVRALGIDDVDPLDVPFFDRRVVADVVRVELRQALDREHLQLPAPVETPVLARHEAVEAGRTGILGLVDDAGDGIDR